MTSCALSHRIVQALTALGALRSPQDVAAVIRVCDEIAADCEAVQHGEASTVDVFQALMSLRGVSSQQDAARRLMAQFRMERR